MDQITEDAVRRIVEALVEDRAMFSLHDITTLARKEGLTVKHYGHGGVREYVNALLVSPMFVDYNATSNGEFNILHHYEDDVSEYDKDEHRAASPAVKPNLTVAGCTNTPASTPAPAIDDGKVDVDQRGRLCVRAAELRKLGVQPGDTVTVDLDSALISIHSNAPKTTFLVVDKNNDLRLSAGILRKIFGYPAPDRYELVFNAGDAHNAPWIEIA
jgi:hypothetical protein